jgi:predicted phage terminase large subunit-like protein
MAEIKARPTLKQNAFLEASHRFRLFTGGVGSGKTFAGALATLRMPAGSRGMVVAPTYPMLKDASLKVWREMGDAVTVNLNRSEMTARLIDGTEVLFRSADKPDRLRGANLGWVWIDEGAYCKKETWDVLLGRVRLKPGRVWVTTTPRGENWLYDVFGPDNRTEDHYLVRAATTENPYLPQHYIDSLRQRYTEQQRLQEMEGEFVTLQGAIFRASWIDEGRVPEAPESLARVVIGVDPAGTHRPDSDETGIVVCAKARDGAAYVLEDASGRYSPPEWARAVRRLWDTYSADKVVAERNYGGDMVESTLQAYGGEMGVETVSATRGKVIRAEPLAAPYERGDVHHVGVYADLERQMTTYDPQDRSAASPDRMDALVWALTELMIDTPRPSLAFA